LALGSGATQSIDHQIIPLASRNRGDNVHGVDRWFRWERASRSTPVAEAHGNQLASAEVLQCMIFLSSDPNAELVEIEYFIDKKLARTNVTLEQWNKHFHDHKEEIATGRVQVLDVPPEKAKEIAEAASQTDGIIFHLWPVGAKVPNAEVMFPTAVSHKPVEKLEIPK
jgi:Protein of unknown function (DUF1264)